MAVTHIDFEDTLGGNYFRGTAIPFKHTYPTASNGVEYLAFFTGGNRVQDLNNNKAVRQTTVQLVLMWLA